MVIYVTHYQKLCFSSIATKSTVDCAPTDKPDQGNHIHVLSLFAGHSPPAPPPTPQPANTLTANFHAFGAGTLRVQGPLRGHALTPT